MARQQSNPKDFKNLTVDLNKMVSMTVSEKLSMLQSSLGQELLSALTPEQLANMFPNYYLKRLPDVGKDLPGVRNLAPASRADADASMKEDTALLDNKRRFRPSGKMVQVTPAYEPPWVKKLQEETQMKISDPTAKAELTAEKKQLLDDLAKGKIDGSDPRVGFLKDWTKEDLLEVGIVKTIDGDSIKFEQAPTEASKLSDEQIAEKLRTESKETFTPRERAVLDLISKREGSKDPNIIFGDTGNKPGSGKYSQALGLDKRSLTNHSIAEVLELQTQLTRMTGQNNVAGGKGTSAVGTGQMIRGTLIDNLRALKIPESEWGNIKFDKNLQERLTLMNFKTSGIGDPNADPSTWNLDRLGKQYESLDISKGFKGISSSEMATIKDASPDRPKTEITAEAIAEKRTQLVADERQKQATRLAEKTIGELPQGVEPNIVKFYNTLEIRQKQDFLSMIEKKGEGDINKGVAKINELYLKSPDQSQALVGMIKQDTGEVVTEKTQSAQRNRPLDPKLTYRMEEAVRSVYGPGYRVEVYSGGENPNAKVSNSGRHDHGKAADIRVISPDGKIMQRQDQIPLVQYWKHKGYGGIGIGMANGGLHLDIARQGEWGYKGASKSYADLLPVEKAALAAVSKPGFDLNALVKDGSYYDFAKKVETTIAESKKKGKEMSFAEAAESVRKTTEQDKQNAQVAQAKPQATAEAVRKNDKPGYIPAQQELNLPQQQKAKGDASSTKGASQQAPQQQPNAQPNAVKEEAKKNQPGYIPPPQELDLVSQQNVKTGQTTKQDQPANANAQQEPQQKGNSNQAAATPTAQQAAEVQKNASDKTEDQKQTAKQEPKKVAQAPENELQEIQPIAAFADGGTAEVNSDEIKAMPIQSMKGDNSVVVDAKSNPLFTMNTKEETAQYDPKTREVDVVPKAEQKDEQPSADQPKETNTKEGNSPESKMVQPQPPQSSSFRSTDISSTATMNVFKDPSFERAMSRTRFGNDPMGGHFDLASVS